MPPTRIGSLDQLKALVGQEIAVTPWLEITQQRVDQFAAATEDRQWIHVDAARAQRESPYGGTIAHGFLTLSLLSFFLAQAIEMEGVRMGINYGLNRVRFTAPVVVGERIRSRFTLQQADDIAGGVQMIWSVVIEAQQAGKPCCIAEWLTRRYA